MYVIVLILFMGGSHQIGSNQILYPNQEMCETDRAVMLQKLENTKPTPDSFVITKCVEMSFAKESKGIAL